MANEAMQIHKMATETNQEADYLEAENFKLETELKKLERDIKGMRSAINTNFLLPRRSPTVTRISPALSGSLPPGRRSFDFMQNFQGGSRHTPRCGSSDTFTNLEIRIYEFFYQIFMKISFSTDKLSKNTSFEPIRILFSFSIAQTEKKS